MLFTSTVFLFLFLPILLACYFLARGIALRNAVLLAASLFFYSFGEYGFVLLLLASIGINHVFGRGIDRRRGRGSGAILALGIVSNLALLGFFKYANFVVDNLNPMLISVGVLPIRIEAVHLPLGISFFTFQAMSFLFDIHRGVVTDRPGLLRTALYISLFPQLIAGPIVRYASIADQLLRRVVSGADFATGVRRFTIGLAKKALVADALAIPADAIFAIPEGQLSFAVAWLGASCFALQIYFDFSGYTDMAIGLGRMFGFRLPENFNHPYVATSMRDFWRRWHITLSTWFRDYLYIPMGGSRRSSARVAFNLLTVFVLCGLWHEAKWNFVLWGLIHGAFLAVERTRFGNQLAAAPRWLRHIYVVVVVVVAWVPFRTESLPAAQAYVAALVGLGAGGFAAGAVDFYWTPRVAFWMAVAILGSTPAIGALGRRLRGDGPESKPVAWVEWATPAVLCAMFLASVAALAAGTQNPFIYFRF